MPSLSDLTISGIFWSFIQKVGSKGISFVVTIVLARLLTPEDFGLIGMLTIFIQLSQTLINGGFSQALIQKKEVDNEDYSSVFYINLIVSGVLYLIIFLTAPFIASFYHQPALTPLVRVLSLVFVVNAFSFVQEARLTKSIRFKTLMYIHIPSTIFGGVVSILMAILGYGVWSIVAMQLVTRIAYSVQIWFYAKWKPLLAFNAHKASKLFSFGSKLMISGTINTIYANIYLVVIGKFFPIKSVGYYQNANNLVQVSTGILTSVFSSVTFTIFASIQDNNKRLKEGYKIILRQLFFWLCPIFVLAGVLAVPMFRFVFTEKWLPAVPYFRWLCIVGILFPLNSYNLNIVNIKGRSDIDLKLTIIEKTMITIGLFLAIPFGIWAILALQAFNAVFFYVLNSYYTGRFIDYGMIEQIKDILPTLLLSIAMGVIVFFVEQSLVEFSDLIRLVIGFAVGASFYWLSAKCCNLSPYLDFVSIVKHRLLSKFA